MESQVNLIKLTTFYRDKTLKAVKFDQNTAQELIWTTLPVLRTFSNLQESIYAG